MKDGGIKKVAEISRIIVGITFMFSGFVKAVDPLGFTYKIQDYLISFNHTELFPLALPVAILLVVLEFTIGAFILFGIWRKTSSLLALAFMLFFTPLTLWIAIKNPVKDCGCFGDALVIGNWQTFYKNIVLLVLVVVLVFCHRNQTSFFSRKTAWIAGVFTLLFALFFALHNVYNLPVFDFRPYKIGANIPKLIHVDPSKSDVYENIFIYSKNGENKEFTEENYPWNDSTWTFVEMKSKLIKKGETPKIEDFSIHKLGVDSTKTWKELGDITHDVLSDTSYVFLMTSPDYHAMRTNNMNAFLALNKYALEHHYSFYLLTSWSLEQIEEWNALQKKSGANYSFCHTDERVLKTMIRSNPGLMVLKNGTVIGKWSNRHIPSERKIEKIMSQTAAENPQQNNLVVLLFILSVFIIPLLAIKWIDGRREKQGH